MDTDWIALWRDLAESFIKTPKQRGKGLGGRWERRAHARGYSDEQQRRDRDDPLMHFVLNLLEPDDTVLDIGAGIGRWSIPMAMACKKVTALDAHPRMLEILLENAAAENAANIETVLGDWPAADVSPRHHVLSTHSVYISPDIGGFVRKMEECALKKCFLVMRVPQHDGIIGALSRRIHGTFHDSPNFIVGYNALLQMGIRGHVVMEERSRPWHNKTLEEALSRAKRHLHLDTDTHDNLIMDMIKERLVLRDGQYWWPDGMRSALVWWRPGRSKATL